MKDVWDRLDLSNPEHLELALKAYEQAKKNAEDGKVVEPADTAGLADLRKALKAARERTLAKGFDLSTLEGRREANEFYWSSITECYKSLAELPKEELLVELATTSGE